MKSHKISQSGQAIIYVILLGASVLGAALVANQNILVDILRTKRLEEANIAYYVAEGAMEEKLLEVKQKGIAKTATDKTKPSDSKASADIVPASNETSNVLTSDQLLPETQGILFKDQSVTIDATQFKNQPVQIILDTSFTDPKTGFLKGFNKAPDALPEHQKIEIRTFDKDGKVSPLVFYDKSRFQDPDKPINILTQNQLNIQIKPYGGDIKFKIISTVSVFNSSKKILRSEGSFGNSSRGINFNIDEVNLLPLPIFDFGLFSQGTTDLLK